MKRITLSKNVDKDIVLCETTNRIVSNRTSDMLLACSVPFTKSLNRVPLFKRREYNGASKVYRIFISRNQYSNARRVLSGLEKRDYDRLLVNVL